MSKSKQLKTEAPDPPPAAAERFEMLPLSQLRESPLNPRKRFNPHRLEELAASIAERGVITPLIVREIHGTRIGSNGKPLYEIAAGHRRFRAAMSRGLQPLPCRILDLTDAQFLEIVSIENLQREDIHPLEEADGFRELLKRNGYDVAVLADKIGKTEAYVRGRLALCDLIPVVRESFLQDNITIGHARLISRLDPDRQEDALRLCFENRYIGGKAEPQLISVAEFRAELKSSQGADLSQAPFLLDSEIGGIGPCTACPKCTGVQRSLLADDTGEQTCLDRPCYDRKVQAHIKALTASGFVQISHTGKPPEGALGYNDYVEAMPPTDQIEGIKADIEFLKSDEDERSQPGAKEELEHLKKELAELEADTGECPHVENAVYVDGRTQTGKTIKICRNPSCPVHGSDLDHGHQVARSQAKAATDIDQWQIERQKHEAERKIKAKARKRAWEALLSAMGPTPKIDRFILQAIAHGFYHRFNEDFCRAFGIDWQKGDLARHKGKAWTETATDSQLIRAIVAAAFWEPGLQEFFDAQHTNRDIWQMFCEGLKRHGTSYEQIEKQVRAELAADEKKKRRPKADKPAPTKQAAKSNKMAAAGDDEDEE